MKGQKLIEKISVEMKELFVPGPGHQHMVYEGVDCNDLAMEILNKNVDEIFTVILKEYPPENMSQFEQDFSRAFKQTFGELIYEISEGLKNGYADFEAIFTENFKGMISRMVGAQMGDLAVFMALPTMIPHIKKCYEDYKAVIEEKV